MPATNTVIETKELTKRYQSVTAVDRLNLSIREGEIYGLLGPNGAGKTTTILMLLGLTDPSDGKALVGGYDPTRNPLAVKRNVGYLPDNVGFYDDLSGRENLAFTARLNGLQGPETEKRIAELLDRVGLSAAADRKAGTYSRGMRQRLGIADALVKDPRILILDEPTLGIDPEGTRAMLDLIRQLSRDGRTIMLSSHLLYQIQQVCDRVGIFVQGRLLAEGPIDSLADQVLGGEPHRLELIAEPDDSRLAALIAAVDGIDGVERANQRYIVSCSGDRRAALSRALSSGGYTLLHLRRLAGDLDDIYRRYFAREEVV